MPILTRVAAHPDDLLGSLCAELASPPDDPFAPELVAVPTRGIERWLTQQIASRLGEAGAGDGICANVRFPSPHGLVRGVLEQVPELAAAVIAWEDPGLTGHLLGAIDENLDRPWMDVLRRHLDPAAGPANRLPAATRIAGLFTRYARRRPAMIRRWAAGADAGPGGGAIDPAHRWQPALWRVVRERIGIPSLPELLPAGLAPVATGVVDLDLPERIAVYGLTAVDPLDLDVLAAVAGRRQVHLYVLHPSPELWERAAPRLEPTGPDPAPHRRQDDPTADLAVHPLLRSWGVDSRELQAVLAGHGLAGSPAPAAGTHNRSTGADLLARLQGDLLANRRPTPGHRSGNDRSVQIHSCYGSRRQVEVLRDAILHVLATDPSLEPRDVVIMTPDLATFAPLLEAAFPASTEAANPGGSPDLRVRIADRSPAATNPLVRFVATVLDLAGSRLEAGAIRQLVTRPVVQRRFGFDADTAGAIVAVVDDIAVAWGLDAAHRERHLPTGWGATAGEARTWRRGLDRALAGVFYSDDAVRVVGDTVPLDGVEGQDAVPVGHLAAIVERMGAIADRLGRPMPLSRWPTAIADSVRLLAAPGWGEEWQWDQLDRLLGDTFPVAEGPEPPDDVDPPVSLPEVRRAVARWVEDRPSPLHFGTGDVTVCTLAPMRSVPYRVVCLLGMDDDRFPRGSRDDGDDLLVGQELVGDHDRSLQDRQLLLDAVMAAGDHLLVTYSGRDATTNAELPPSVPVAELVDTLAAMVDDAAGLVTEHPLQSFSETNFVPGALGVPGAWSHDTLQLAGAVAARNRMAPGEPERVSWPSRPESDEGDDLRLADLIAFLRHPVKRFVRARLGFGIPDPGEIPDDTVPTALTGLERWGVADRLLAGLVAGHPPERLADRERHRDVLPPGRLGEVALDRAMETASRLWNAATEHGYRPEGQRPYSGVVTAGGRRVEGSVEADPETGQIAVVTPSRIGARWRLEVYARQVFLSALEPQVSWRVRLIGRRPVGEGHVAVTIDPLGTDAVERREQAISRLGDLVDLYRAGHREPLPLPCETAYVWQRWVGGDRGKAFGEARRTWETDRYRPESADPSHAMALPGLGTFQALLDAGFEECCRRLWGPILPLCREVRV